jgi:hypothetical protein
MKMNSVLSLQFSQTPQFDRALSEMYNYRPGLSISDTQKMIYIQRIFIREKTALQQPPDFVKEIEENIYIGNSKFPT